MGSGLDLGGGLLLVDPSTGLSADVRVRMLLVHEAAGFRDRWMSVSLSYNQTPSTPLGLTARVAPSWAVPAVGGRLDAEVGYGLPVGTRLVGTPRVGVGTSEWGREYRLGYHLGGPGRRGVGSRAGRRGAAPGEPGAPRPGSGRPRAGHGALVGRPPAGPAVV